MKYSKFAICNNQDFQFLSQFLSQYTKRAYFVGGCVRDFFLGLHCEDFDIEIYDITPKKFDEIMHKLGAKGVGKSFFVYKYKNFDLALARKENKICDGHRGFNVQICNNEKIASSRRDFTINSLMVNIFTGELLDFWNAKKDLKNKILRIVNENTFCEDSLRVLRAVQFISRFNLKIDENSFKLMKKIDISDLSYDRIKTELNKLFCASYLNLGLEMLRKLNLDRKIFNTTINQNFIKKAKKHFDFTQNILSVPYDIFCEYNVIIKGFESVSKHKVIKKASANNFLNLALKIPLKDWLGINSQKRKNLAIKLGIYDKKLSIDLDNDILKHLTPKERLNYIKTSKQKAITLALRKINDRN